MAEVIEMKFETGLGNITQATCYTMRLCGRSSWQKLVIQ